MQERINKSKRNQTVEIETTAEDLEKLRFKTGRKYILKLLAPLFVVQLETDPRNPAAGDDRYTLYSTDENRSYTCTLTPGDDQNKDDAFITLHYDKLRKTVNYTLEIDPGKEGGKYCLFENIPYRELVEG